MATFTIDSSNLVIGNTATGAQHTLVSDANGVLHIGRADGESPDEISLEGCVSCESLSATSLAACTVTTDSVDAATSIATATLTADTLTVASINTTSVATTSMTASGSVTVDAPGGRFIGNGALINSISAPSISYWSTFPPNNTIITNTGINANHLFISETGCTSSTYSSTWRAAVILANGRIMKSACTFTSTKMFNIPHPLDPGRRLVHSCIEGPRADLMYRGEVTLRDGSAVVNLDTDCSDTGGMTPGTFAKLCRNPTVHLTNHTSPAWVRGTVRDGTLHITCEKPTQDQVHWMVVAERQDNDILQCRSTDQIGRLILEPTTS